LGGEQDFEFFTVLGIDSVAEPKIAGHVAVKSFEFCADVDEDGLVFLEFLVGGVVVWDRGVFAEGDDRRKCDFEVSVVANGKFEGEGEGFFGDSGVAFFAEEWDENFVDLILGVADFLNFGGGFFSSETADPVGLGSEFCVWEVLSDFLKLGEGGGGVDADDSADFFAEVFFEILVESSGGEIGFFGEKFGFFEVPGIGDEVGFAGF